MSYIDGIFDFLRDKTLTFSKKFLIIFGIVLLVLIFDWLFGISFNYSINQRINQIEKIENMKLNFSLNDTVLSELNRLETKIIDRFDYVKLIHFQEFKFKDKTIITSDTFNTLHKHNLITKKDTLQKFPNSKITTTVSKRKVFPRNWIWDLVSSTFIYLIIILFLIILPFTQKSEFLTTLLGSIILIIAIGLFCWLIYWIFSNIPTIIRPWINYTINAIVQIVIVIIIALIFSQQSKKKK